MSQNNPVCLEVKGLVDLASKDAAKTNGGFGPLVALGVGISATVIGGQANRLINHYTSRHRHRRSHC